MALGRLNPKVVLATAMSNVFASSAVDVAVVGDSTKINNFQCMKVNKAMLEPREFLIFPFSHCTYH